MIGHEEGPAKPERIRSLKSQQPGYLWGLSPDEPTTIGPPNKWHFRAQPGMSIPYWELWSGAQPIGLHVFPIHEAHNWVQVLEDMLKGLNDD